MDYKDRLPSEKEEIESLKRYMGPFHAEMNILPNLQRILEMKEKGWKMAQLKNIESLIDDFVNVYGKIYSDGESKDTSKLYRGMAKKELEGLQEGKEISSVMSTSLDESIAKRFCEYENAAISKVSTQNLPHLYVEQYRENGENEKEVIILPFSRIKEKSHSHQSEGYKYYDVVLEKGNLQDIPEKELEVTKRECIQGFETFLSQLEERHRLEEEYETVHQRLAKSGLSYEDIKYLSEENSARLDRCDTLNKEIRDFTDKFGTMLRGLCKQREKDKDQEREDKLADIEKRKEERRKVAEQKRITRIDSEIREIKSSMPSNVEQIKSELEQHMGLLQKYINSYKRVSANLGISSVNIVNSEAELNARKDEIIQAMIGSTQMVLKSNDGISREERHAKLQGYEANLEIAKMTLQDLPRLTEVYKLAGMQDLKYNLNQKVQDIIYRSECAKLQEQKRSVIEEKETLLGRILGIRELKNARIKNIDSKIRLATAQKNIRNPQNSINEMLQGMYDSAYRYYGGELTPEMENMEKLIRGNFKNNLKDSGELREEATKRTQTKALVAVNNKHNFLDMFSNKRKIKGIEQDTGQVRSEISRAEAGNIRAVSRNLELPTANARIQKVLRRINETVNIDRDERSSALQERNGQDILE